MVNCCTILYALADGLSVITFIVTSVSSETLLYHSQYFNTPIRRQRSSTDISTGTSPVCSSTAVSGDETQLATTYLYFKRALRSGN